MCKSKLVVAVLLCGICTTRTETMEKLESVCGGGVFVVVCGCEIVKF